VEGGKRGLWKVVVRVGSRRSRVHLTFEVQIHFDLGRFEVGYGSLRDFLTRPIPRC
jgi:hypothetical protein